MIHLYDGNNVMLRDLDKIGHERIGLRMRLAQCEDGDTHIFCWDGKGHNKRRQDIYPAYKANRVPMGEDRFAQIQLFRECLTHAPAIQIQSDGWEADDVIGALTARFVSRKVAVTVHTNDADYWQLAVYKNVTLNGVKPLDCAPQHTPIFKASVGDSSDNIIGISGFGPKAWAMLPPFWINEFERALADQDILALLKLPLPKRVLTKLADPQVVAEAAAALIVTRFFPIPDAELDAGITQGVPNRGAYDALLRRFFL